MQGIANVAEAGLLLVSFLFAAGVTLLVVLESWKSGLRSMLKRGLLAALLFATIGASLYYWRLANTRSLLVLSDCSKFVAPHRQYFAQVCYAGDFNVLLTLVSR